MIHEISSENENLWGSNGAPSEGPSGEDDCSDTQWGFCGPNAPFKMKGGRKQAGLKWRPVSEAQSGGDLSCAVVCLHVLLTAHTVVAFAVVN